jgi:multiple sugar transport system permease protein
VLLVFVLIFLTPFYWMVATALKSEVQLFALPPAWVPSPPIFENFARVFQEVPFSRFVVNSATLVFWNVLGQVISTTLIAYGFARLRFPGRNVLFLILLGTLMVHEQVTLVPQFILFAKLGWVNTILPLVVPTFFGNPFYIFLLRQFLMQIPREISEAARIDGANRWKQTWHVTLPGIRPMIVVLMVLNIGTFMAVGFEKVLLLYNPLTYETADVIATYVYRVGLSNGQYSYGAAIGLFEALIGLILVFSANAIGRRLTGNSLW